MNTRFRMQRRSFASRALAVSTGLALQLSVLQAATVFNFGPSKSFVDDSPTFNRPALLAGNGPYVSATEFSSVDPLSPTSGYNGPAFYGGYTYTSSSYAVGFASGSTAAGQGIANDYAQSGGNDAIYFNVTGPNSDSYHATNMTFASVIMFKQESFEAGFTHGAIGIDGFRITLYKTSSSVLSSAFTPVGRMVVEIGGVYYISEEVFSKTTASLETFQVGGNELLSMAWAEYHPEENIFYDTGASFSSLSLANVTSVGFYIEDRSFKVSDGTIGMRLAVSEFSVTGSAIPEANTVAYIGFGVAIVFGSTALRSRKRRRISQTF